jgi:hypothetical protein
MRLVSISVLIMTLAVYRRSAREIQNAEVHMDNTTVLIIILVLILLFGGGWYGRGRWY